MLSPEVAEAVRNFLLADSWEASRAVVEADSNLFTDETRDFVASMATSARDAGDEALALRLDEHVSMLEAWAHDNTSHQIGTLLADGSIAPILQELTRPATPPEMPFRIELSRQALELVDPDANVELWGLLQSVLGTSLLMSQVGNDAERIDQAIDAYHASLKALAHTPLTVERARISNNLARAYELRADRDSSPDDLILAIEAYDAAAATFRAEGDRRDLAECLVNLGNARLHAQTADRETERERAIGDYREAEELVARDDEPLVWAQAQANLGIALTDRVEGRREENLSEAISRLEESLKVLDPASSPIAWAQAQASLGNALLARSVDGGDDTEHATVAYSLAIEIFAQYGALAQRAIALTNLGRAFQTRALGDRATNLERAIECHRAALDLVDRRTNSLEWSQASSNLGSALRVRLLGERAENIEAAIVAIQDALAVLEHLDRPLDHAQALKHLGAAYAKRVEGEPQENLRLALAAYEQALAERERIYGHSHPRVAAVLYSLAKVQRRLGNLDEARSSLERAVEIDETHAYANRARLARRYRKLAETAAAAGDAVAAVRAVERALALDEETRGPTDHDVTRDLQELGRYLQVVGRVDEAAIAVERAATIERLLLGPRHPRVRNTLVQLTETLQRAGELTAAEELRRRVDAIDASLPGGSADRAAKILGRLGKLVDEITKAAADDRTRRRAEGFADSGLTRNRPRIAAFVATVERLADRRPRVRARGPAAGEQHASPEPTSLRFRETMGGLLELTAGEPEALTAELRLDLDVAVADLARFLDAAEATASVTGTLSIEPSCGLRAIDGGTFNVTADPLVPSAHTISYVLPFVDADGERRIVTAKRLIDDADGKGLVAATMLCDVSVTAPDDEGDATAVGNAGTGHVGAIRSLASFRASGTTNAPDLVDRFGWVTMRELWPSHVTRMTLAGDERVPVAGG
jgi:tetratricopeptide (TPR) repeat protein